MADETTAVILLGRGGIGAAAKAELTAVVDALTLAMACAPGAVQPAFVDRTQPALPEALSRCSEWLQAAQARPGCIVIVPVFVPDEPALRRWLHKVVMRWRESQPPAAAPARLVFASPLLQTEGLAGLLQDKIRHAVGLADVPSTLGLDEWKNDPAAWSSVPVHQHHVLWCTGPRCAAQGALALWPKLAQTLRDNPELKRRVMPLQTSCQYPCNHGPLMILYPGGTWYGHLDEASLGPVLTRHVLQGVVDPVHVVHQNPPQPGAGQPLAAPAADPS